MSIALCAAVLVGGKGTRLGGVCKPLVEIEGQTILARQLDVLAPRFSAVALVGGDPEDFAEYALPVVPDERSECGPLAGVASALAWANEPHCFVVAGDMPYLSGAVVDRMVEVVTIDPSVDIAIVEDGARMHPLHAIYSTRCLPLVRRQMDRGRFAVRELADLTSPLAGGVKRHVFHGSEQRDLDPALRFLHNVNRPSDLG